MQKSFFRRNWVVGYALGIITVAVGVFVMFQQESFLRIFIVLLGLFATLSGISSLISLRRLSLALFFRRATVIRAIVSIAVGLFALIMPLTTATISWVVFIYSLALSLAFSALVTIVDLIAMRSKGYISYPLLGDGIFSLIVSVLLFSFPRQIGEVLLKVVGVLIIAAGISLIVTARFGQRTPKASEVLIEGDGEVVDS
jgi:uncharacterized membrane protein HdeD (DUF308 family)